MTFGHFTLQQIILLAVSLVILIASIITFELDKKRTALILLFFCSLGLGFFIASLDHFLVLWDEQYHALVAKHMLDNPFKPTLYSIPLLEYDYKNWTANHIWLHKQPLYLWQMALSLKIFGINEMAIRIPSIVLHAIATIMIYRIGKISNSSNIGYYGALFFAVAYFPLEMVAGKIPTDHNDLIFLCYVTASFWAWFEYSDSRRNIWLILIGVFAGFSVLVKWLPGLLVFATWFVSLVIENYKNRRRVKLYVPILISITIALIIFIPWQLYIFYKFPMEARNEYLLNIRHFFEPVEGHDGTSWYHFNAFRDIYGSGFLVPVFYLVGLILLVKKSTRLIYKSTIILSVVFIYLFYSVVKTKMIAFCLIVSPFFFLGLAALINSFMDTIANHIQSKKFDVALRAIVLIVMCKYIFSFNKIQDNHTLRGPNENKSRIAELNEMAFINNLKTRLGKIIM